MTLRMPGAILQARKAHLVPWRESCRISNWIVRAERGNGIQEPIRMENEAIDQTRGDNSCPVGQWRVEAIVGRLPVRGRA